MIRDLLWAAAAVYIAILVLLFLFQRRLVFVPTRGAIGSPAAAGVPEMRLLHYRAADGGDLVGWYGEARDGPTIVYFHGNAGTLADRAFKARFFLDQGYGVFLASYRGYGENSGAPSESGVYGDARAALDRLASLGVPAASTVLYGESLGSGVAVQMATERQAAALILEAPFTALPDIAAFHYPWTPARWVLRDRFASLAKIGQVAIPILVLHGEQDRVIPIRFGRRLFEAAREPKEMRVFPEGDHSGLYDVGAGEAVDEFLRHLSGGNCDQREGSISNGVPELGNYQPKRGE